MNSTAMGARHSFRLLTSAACVGLLGLLLAGAGCQSGAQATEFGAGRVTPDIPATSPWHVDGPAAAPDPGGDRRVTIVVDIDETISMTDYAGFLGLRENTSRPFDGAPEVLTRLSEHFDLIYLTARPQWLFAETRAWLRDAGFPPGPVVATGRIVDLFWPAPFKTRVLALLRLNSPGILIGIGDRHSDDAAYTANGMLSLVVHPRRNVSYHDRAVKLEDWQAVGRFFETHEQSLRVPEGLMRDFGVVGARLDPATVPTQVEVDLSLIVKLPLAAPALLLEPLVKIESLEEQRQARRAIPLAELSFAQALELAIEHYGEENLLEVRLVMRRGRPAYEVRFVDEKGVRRAVLEGMSGAVEGVRQSKSSMRGALEARRLARISLREALALALEELAGNPYELELEMDDGQPTYELSVEAQGQFIEIELHALTGEILEVEQETAVK